MPEEPLETPDNFGRLPRPRPGDWRREDRERFRSSQVIPRLAALFVIPATFICFVLASNHVLALPAALVIVLVLWIAGVVALWFGAKGTRAR